MDQNPYQVSGDSPATTTVRPGLHYIVLAMTVVSTARAIWLWQTLHPGPNHKTINVQDAFSVYFRTRMGVVVAVVCQVAWLSLLLSPSRKAGYAVIGFAAVCFVLSLILL